MFQPRPKQREVLAYSGGRMGVAAVPGSGKTQTLSYLAAQLVAAGGLEDDQEVLVVTLVNSAVDNFAGRVGAFVHEMKLLPNVGYRVRTLHGLAHDIVRENCGLVGLSDDFQIVDEREAAQMLADAADAWAAQHPDALEEYLGLALSDEQRAQVRHNHRQWSALINEVAGALVNLAKDQEWTPVEWRAALDRLPEPLPLLEMGSAIYADYQRALSYRGAVDFHDLIRLAVRALRTDREYLARLRLRWPFILEDEAQDSSRLQEEILSLLAGPTGNWVRVGDPNQAIYETFTRASPRYLREFLARPDVQARNLPNSGRSTYSIIKLANYLVRWTRDAHPVEAVRGALLSPPDIEPTAGDDPQPNPPDRPDRVSLLSKGFTPDEEVSAVVASIARWLPTFAPGEAPAVAVLVPSNERGFKVVQALERRGLPCVELLRSTGSTREIAGCLAAILNHLAEPDAPARLVPLYHIWLRREPITDEGKAQAEAAERLLRRCATVEDYLWPRPGADWLAGLPLAESDGALIERLTELRGVLQRWHAAALLPVDQLLLTLAQDIFERPAELALTHKLATLLRAAAGAHADWRLGQLAEELAVIARNERRFIGFSEDDLGFDPQRHRGQVVVCTVHRAKGLEWDRVYLMALNNYDYPSALPHDTYKAERWFVRDSLNLTAEGLAQLRALFVSAEDIMAPYIREGAATQQARYDYAAERLRLLYVGITRARQELIVTWNTGRSSHRQQSSAALLALQTWWEAQHAASGA